MDTNLSLLLLLVAGAVMLFLIFGTKCTGCRENFAVSGPDQISNKKGCRVCPTDDIQDDVFLHQNKVNEWQDESGSIYDDQDFSGYVAY